MAKLHHATAKRAEDNGATITGDDDKAMVTAATLLSVAPLLLAFLIF